MVNYPWSRKPKEEVKVEANLVPEEEPKVVRAIVSQMQSAGSSPSSTFAAQVKVFKKMPVIREAIVHGAMEICGLGIFTSDEKADAIKLPKAGSEVQWTAKQAVDFWNKENNLDEVVLSVAIELLAYGNSFWLITPDGLQPIPIDKIMRAVPVSPRIPIQQQYNLMMDGTYGSKVLPFGSFVHFRLNMTTSSCPLGSGCVAALIESYDTDIPSLIEVYNAIQVALRNGVGKWINPLEAWTLPELSDEQLGDKDEAGTVAHAIDNLPSSGKRITMNTDLKIQTSQARRDTGWDTVIQGVTDAVIMALGNPALKASVESGFTEASIRGAINLFRKKVVAARRQIQRTIEKLWSKVLSEYGFDAELSQIKLTFGPDEVEWTVPDLVNAFNAKLISAEEARAILREKARWKLEHKAPTPEVKQPEEEEKPTAKESAPQPIIVPTPNITITIPQPKKTKTTRKLVESGKNLSEEEITEVEYHEPDSA